MWWNLLRFPPLKSLKIGVRARWLHLNWIIFLIKLTLGAYLGLPSLVYRLFRSPLLESIRASVHWLHNHFFSSNDSFPISIVMGPHCARGRSVTGMVYYSSPIAGFSSAVNRRQPFIDLGAERQSRAKLLVQGNKATAMLEPRPPDLKLEVLNPRLSQPHQILPISRSSFLFFKQGRHCKYICCKSRRGGKRPQQQPIKYHFFPASRPP